MLAEAATFEDRGGKGVEHGHGLRLGKLSGADAGEKADFPFFEGGRLEVDPDLVGENQLGDSEVRSFTAGGDCSGLAEIGVAEGHRGARLRCLDRLSARLLEQRRKICFPVLRRFLGGQDQVETRGVPEFQKCLVTGRGVHLFENLRGDRKVSLGVGKHRFAVYGAGENGGDAFGLAGRLLFHLLLIGVEEV